MSEERSYIAFISYRHKPLDAKAARMIEKRIESYRIPKELRKTPDSDRLGYVFRDEDELPLSSSLSDSILEALDRSRFLIVICTPDLPQSKWCEQEIRYFLQTHDRDHLLAVLADGSGEISFSPLMLHEYDENGKAISDMEPLFGGYLLDLLEDGIVCSQYINMAVAYDHAAERFLVCDYYAYDAGETGFTLGYLNYHSMEEILAMAAGIGL